MPGVGIDGSVDVYGIPHPTALTNSTYVEGIPIFGIKVGTGGGKYARTVPKLMLLLAELMEQVQIYLLLMAELVRLM